jgi:hypothetical protein
MNSMQQPPSHKTEMGVLQIDEVKEDEGEEKSDSGELTPMLQSIGLSKGSQQAIKSLGITQISEIAKLNSENKLDEAVTDQDDLDKLRQELTAISQNEQLVENVVNM